VPNVIIPVYTQDTITTRYRLAGPSWFFFRYIFLFRTRISYYYYYGYYYTRVPASVKNEFHRARTFSELFHSNSPLCIYIYIYFITADCTETDGRNDWFVPDDWCRVHKSDSGFSSFGCPRNGGAHASSVRDTEIFKSQAVVVILLPAKLTRRDVCAR